VNDHRVPTTICSRSCTSEHDERPAHRAPVTAGASGSEEVKTRPLCDLRDRRPHRKMNPTCLRRGVSMRTQSSGAEHAYSDGQHDLGGNP
jgi:hypothetical protein